MQGKNAAKGKHPSWRRSLLTFVQLLNRYNEFFGGGGRPICINQPILQSCSLFSAGSPQGWCGCQHRRLDNQHIRIECTQRKGIHPIITGINNLHGRIFRRHLCSERIYFSRYVLNGHNNVKRVMAEAVRWGKKGARINSISPSIIVTPLALDDFNGPRENFYKNMFAKCPAGRPGTADEVANVAELLMGGKGAFITGADFLIDGGATASFFYGSLKP